MYLFSFSINLWIELCLPNLAVELSFTSSKTLSMFWQSSSDASLLPWKPSRKEWTITFTREWWLRNLKILWYFHVFKAWVTAKKIMVFWSSLSLQRWLFQLRANKLLAIQDSLVMSRCIIQQEVGFRTQVHV